ncbi:MAG: hypothetical protein C4527_12255 [Candidatus Omnitrophota bacterium]|nr:MAG: hypothetical protein C4527_12255 [Candidatus Omnitrophota bacterium]
MGLEDFEEVEKTAHLWSEWHLKLESIDVNVGIDNSQFWPDVPEEYHYEDNRSRYQELRKNVALLTPEQLTLIRGKGPYSLPR